MANFFLPDYTIKQPKDVTTPEICAIYRSVSEIPTLEGGGILDVKGEDQGLVSCYATFVQKDLETNSNRKFEKRYNISCPSKSLQKDTKVTACCVDISSSVAENVNVIRQCYSQDGMLKALFRTAKDDGKEKEYLEIWSSCRLVKNVNLTAINVHGKVYGSGTFASFCFSKDNEQVLYVAEKKETPSKSFYERKSQSKKPDDTSDSVGDKFAYKEDWGEQLVGQSDPVLVVFDIKSEDVKVLSGISEDLCPGQAVWGPDGSVVFTGFKNKPRRLGLIYCLNRESAIYHLKIAESGNVCQQVSSDNTCAFSPRVSPCGNFVVFLEGRVHGPHRACQRLMMYSLTDAQCHVLYDIVQENPLRKEASLGIFENELPRRCWIGSGNQYHVIFTTLIGVSKSIVSFSLRTKKMSLLSVVQKEHYQTIFDVSKGYILLQSSAPNSVPSLAVIRVYEEDLNQDVPTFNGTLTLVDSLPSSTDKTLAMLTADMERRLLQTTIRVEFEGFGEFESILLKPSADYAAANTPLIAWIHGGPHSVFSACYMHYAVAFSYVGFSVLLVNYRGSLGFGEHSLNSLPGNVGDQDVKDCHSIIDHAVRNYGIDSKNVFLFGGSHGGFLTTHLIGQYPDYFRAAATRNPVINIASMVDSSDIPDWTFVETGHEYNNKAVLSGDISKRMFEMSPMAHVMAVQAPLLVVIGLDDLRVPSFQGINFHRVLKNLGKITKLLTYPGNTHALSKVEAEGDVFVNVMLWFKEHMY